MCCPQGGYGHRELHSVVQSVLSLALKTLWEKGVPHWQQPRCSPGRGSPAGQGVTPGVFAELSSKERGGSRSSALIPSERGASAQPLLWESWRKSSWAHLNPSARESCVHTSTHRTGSDSLINTQIPFVFSRMGTGTHWAMAWLLPERTTLRGWTYAHNDYSAPFIFMHELDLFYFSKPLFNTRGSAESKKLIQSLLLCTACFSSWKCKNVRMHEGYQKCH